MQRRIVLAAIAAPSLWTGRAAQAAWPDRPIRLVAPIPAGTSTDILARLMATQLSEGLDGHVVVVENRAGAGGTVGSAFVARAAPDGHTLLLGTIGTHAVNPHLMPAIGYDPARDFSPILAHSKTKLLLVVRPQLGPRSLADFLTLARSRPISIGSSGTGTAAHLAHAMLEEATRAGTTHIPYRDASQAITDLLGGRLDAMFYHTQVVRPHILAGAMVGLGITGAARSPLLPAVPTFAEAGQPAIDIEAWWGVYGPPGLPRPIVERVNAVWNAGLVRPDMVALLERNGIEPMGGTPEDLATFQAAELERWGQVVRRAGITAEG